MCVKYSSFMRLLLVEDEKKLADSVALGLRGPVERSRSGIDSNNCMTSDRPIDASMSARSSVELGMYLTVAYSPPSSLT